MLSEKKPSERLRDGQWDQIGTIRQAILDELHAELLELRATVTEHARALAGGAVAEASEGDGLELVRAAYSRWGMSGKAPNQKEWEAIVAALEAGRSRWVAHESDWQEFLQNAAGEKAETQAALTAERSAHKATRERAKAEGAEFCRQLDIFQEQAVKSGETIAQLTRERDEANAFAAAETEHANKWNERYVVTAADRDRIQAELDVASGDLANEQTAHQLACESVWRLTKQRKEAEGELATVRGELEEAKRSHANTTVLLMRERGASSREDSPHAQSSDGLREALQREVEKLNEVERVARLGHSRELSPAEGCVRSFCRGLLAAHPAPTNPPVCAVEPPGLAEGTPGFDSPADGDQPFPELDKLVERWDGGNRTARDCARELNAVIGVLTAKSSPSEGVIVSAGEGSGNRVAPSGEESGRYFLAIGAGVTARSYDGIEGLCPVRIGAHTMTVAEWVGLAKAPLTPWHEVARQIESERDALRARVEKAVGMLRGFEYLKDGNQEQRGAWEFWLSPIIDVLTSDQPPGEERPNDGRSGRCGIRVSGDHWCTLDHGHGGEHSNPSAAPDPDNATGDCPKCGQSLFSAHTGCVSTTSDQPPGEGKPVTNLHNARALVVDTALEPGRAHTPDLVERVCNQQFLPPVPHETADGKTEPAGVVSRIIGALERAAQGCFESGHTSTGTGYSGALRIVREEAGKEQG